MKNTFLFFCVLFIQITQLLAQEKKVSCIPGQSFQKDCNTCFCPSNGDASLAACTRKLCPPTNSNTCVPGQSFQKDCNTCFCPESGDASLAACTKKLCLPNDGDDSTCVPGETFKKDCNICRCFESGLKADAACTRKACTGNEVEEPENPCVVYEDVIVYAN